MSMAFYCYRAKTAISFSFLPEFMIPEGLNKDMAISFIIENFLLFCAKLCLRNKFVNEDLPLVCRFFWHLGKVVLIVVKLVLVVFQSCEKSIGTLSVRLILLY